MSIVHFFELICDLCKERFEDLHERAIFTPTEIRAYAQTKGWKCERPSRLHLHDAVVDLCPRCGGMDSRGVTVPIEPVTKTKKAVA